MNPKMCFPPCTLNHDSSVYKEYLTGPTPFNNAVQNNSHFVLEIKAFFLSILPDITLKVSQYLALENNWI